MDEERWKNFESLFVMLDKRESNLYPGIKDRRRPLAHAGLAFILAPIVLTVLEQKQKRVGLLDGVLNVKYLFIAAESAK